MVIDIVAECIESLLVFSFVIFGTAWSLDLILGGISTALRNAQK